MPNIAAGASATFTAATNQTISIQATGGAVASVSVDGSVREVVSGARVLGPYPGSSVQIAAQGGPVFYETQTARNTVTASRSLTADDNGAVLECTADGITLTVPTGLPANFSCIVIPTGTTSFAASGTLLNGASTTLARAASSNVMVAIARRGSGPNSFIVSGA